MVEKAFDLIGGIVGIIVFGLLAIPGLLDVMSTAQDIDLVFAVPVVVLVSGLAGMALFLLFSSLPGIWTNPWY